MRSTWAGMAGRARAAGETRKRRAALACGAAVLSAAAVAGTAVTAQPAAARAAGSTGIWHCTPKTDFQTTDALGADILWENFCGTGTWYARPVFKVRDASYPYHRVWFHKGRAAWCAWGPAARVVPPRFRYPDSWMTSRNTARC